jgi:soluble lytic murein transglycosylase
VDYKAGKDAQAEEQLQLSLQDGLRIPDYAYLYLGLLQKKSGHLKEAYGDFQKVVALKPPKPTELEARFRQGEIDLAEKNWRAATHQFESLRKGLRSDERYADVLYDLLLASRHDGAIASGGCKWARELYSKYPTYPAIREWGARLDKNTIEGKKVICSASIKEFTTRLQRLWLGGDAERAMGELQTMKTALGEDGAYSIDSMLAGQLVNEGRVEEALKLLLKYYAAERNRPEYLLLLAKTSSRAAEYTSAIAAYKRAYELAPRGKNGANALFQAAFTSYQIQDYDGATQLFGKLVKSFGRSKLAKDAQWHLAWIRYLRGDYEGAFESFTALTKTTRNRVSRHRGHRTGVVVVESGQSDRVHYWLAMSQLKMGKLDEAVKEFQALARDPAIGYYSLLAYYRILSIPGAKPAPGVEARLGMKKSDSGAAPTEEELKAAAEAVEAARQEFEGQQQTAANSDDTDEEETPDAGSAMAATDDDSGASFKEAGLAPRFERARDLVYVGLEDSARRELHEIEKRVRTTTDRQLLMSEYAAVRNFDRSSFIAEVGFGAQRLRDGLRSESRTYWEHAYPRAWESAVVASSRSTSVPEELIWGIMRAESHFRQDAHSPVGALGLMQLMPFTSRKVAGLMSWTGFEVRALLDPESNIKVGSRYLQRLLEKFSGRVPLVAAAYNAGPHRVNAWVRGFGQLDMDEFIEHIPFLETRNYVKRVVRNYNVYSLLYHNSTSAQPWLVQPVGVDIKDSASNEVW